MSEGQSGLRERKRVQTRQRIEAAVLELVSRSGVDQVTVDAISERAEVSPRTFFNYFDSKEDAILGMPRCEADAEDPAVHLAVHGSADLARRVVGLLFAAQRPAITDTAFRSARMQVLRDNPQLLGRQMVRMVRTAEQLTETVRGLLEEERPDIAPVSAEIAETLLMAAMGATRAATRQWLKTKSDMDFSLDELEERAAVLVREVLTLQ